MLTYADVCGRMQGSLYVLCSDFKRTRETAQVFLDALGRCP
jgi:phosphohistidine phosphatase SixA